MSKYDRPSWRDSYPRTGQLWSSAEDLDLLHAVEWTKATTQHIARRHKRTPGAIASRVMLLRDRRIEAEDKALMERELARSWASERETARRAISKIKEAYAGAMWPGERGKTFDSPPRRQCGVKPGMLLGGISPCIVIARPYGIDLVALSDLPPEVAQAIQFGGES